MLWYFPAIIEGLQEDSLLTQEFTDFQDHWSSANKTEFPDSSFETTEVLYKWLHGYYSSIV